VARKPLLAVPPTVVVHFKKGKTDKK